MRYEGMIKWNGYSIENEENGGEAQAPAGFGE
jgi:hypothetical protein